jgi:hypothetical protein
MSRENEVRVSSFFFSFFPLFQGYMLNVRMSHLFAVAHFLLNYVPTVRGWACVLGIEER